MFVFVGMNSVSLVSSEILAATDVICHYLTAQGAHTIILFGSSLYSETPNDLDFGVAGIAPENFIDVWDSVQHLTQYKVDLVDLASIQNENFKQTILQKGHTLLAHGTTNMAVNRQPNNALADLRNAITNTLVNIETHTVEVDRFLLERPAQPTRMHLRYTMDLLLDFFNMFEKINERIAKVAFQCRLEELNADAWHYQLLMLMVNKGNRGWYGEAFAQKMHAYLKHRNWSVHFAAYDQQINPRKMEPHLRNLKAVATELSGHLKRLRESI